MSTHAVFDYRCISTGALPDLNKRTLLTHSHCQTCSEQLMVTVRLIDEPEFKETYHRDNNADIVQTRLMNNGNSREQSGYYDQSSEDSGGYCRTHNSTTWSMARRSHGELEANNSQP